MNTPTTLLSSIVALAFLMVAGCLCLATTGDATGAQKHMYCVRGGQISSYMEGAPCDAYGSNAATRNQTGWNVLSITTNGSVSDEAQAYAAGYLEGYTNAEDITMMFYNVFGPEASPLSANITEWIANNSKWIRAEATAQQHNSKEWRLVALMIQQLDGLYAGMGDSGVVKSEKEWPQLNLMILTASEDILMYEAFSTPPTGGRTINSRALKMHCSALVKVKDDLSDIFFGHVTWQGYNYMLRVFKTYTFNYNSVPLASKTMQFSSYPGQIVSVDDFYSLDSGLAVMETSLGDFSGINLMTQSLLYAYRVTIANRLATSGKEWAQYYVFNNSGTYDNQWMVLDFKRFTPGVGLGPGTFWVLEQAGQFTEAKDMTSVLTMGYWPSYNVPYFDSVYNASDNAFARAAFPIWFSQQNSIRAQLFRQMQGRVHTLADLQYVLQYNDYQVDPLEQLNPSYAISARFDLLPPSTGPKNPFGGTTGFGGVDCKVSSYKDSFLVQQKPTVYGFSGPTPQQEVFSFLTSNATGLEPHMGLPLTWNFTWQTFQYSP